MSSTPASTVPRPPSERSSLLKQTETSHQDVAPLVSRREASGAEKPGTRARQLPALHWARLVGAAHIFLYHAKLPHPSDEYSFGSWGCSWVPFFFALSGFVAAHSQLCAVGGGATLPTALRLAPRPLRIGRRLLAVYPTYLVALLLSMTLQTLPAPLGDAQSVRPEVISELLLLQAWLPGKPYNVPAWYVSALAWLWLLEPCAIRLAEAATRTPRRLALAVLCWLAYAVACPLALFPPLWVHRFPLPSWMTPQGAKWLHIWWAGAALACASDAAARWSPRPPPPRAAAVVAALGLGLVFGLARGHVGGPFDPSRCPPQRLHLRPPTLAAPLLPYNSCPSPHAPTHKHPPTRRELTS